MINDIYASNGRQTNSQTHNHIHPQDSNVNVLNERCCVKNDKLSLNGQHMTESLARLDEIVARSTELILQTRLHSDHLEAKKRDDDCKDDLKRCEIAESASHFNEEDIAESGWELCLSATNAQDLCDLLDTQKTRCEAVISKIEEVRKDLAYQLRQKDQEYVNTLKRNRLEVDLLQERITKEHRIIKDTFEKELKLFQDKLNSDKSEIIQANSIELDSLVMDRKNYEIESLGRQLKILEDQRKEVNERESNGGLETSGLKKTMESEVRKLEINMQNTIAHHKLESDKLQFDVRVVNELSHKTTEIKKQKKRLMRGKGELNKELEVKHRELAKGAKENRILEDDCERIERQLIGLKEKFESFQISDREKYLSIMNAHKDDLKKLQFELNESKKFIFNVGGNCRDTESESNRIRSFESEISFPVSVNSRNIALYDVNTMEDITLDGDLNDHGDSCNGSDDWENAEALITNYKTVLERREGLQSEVIMLEQQNADLEEELQCRFKDKINEELAFPPSATISV